MVIPLRLQHWLEKLKMNCDVWCIPVTIHLLGLGLLPHPQILGFWFSGRQKEWLLEGLRHMLCSSGSWSWDKVTSKKGLFSRLSQEVLVGEQESEKMKARKPMYINEQVSAAGNWSQANSTHLWGSIGHTSELPHPGGKEAGALLPPFPYIIGGELLAGTVTAQHFQPPHVQTKRLPWAQSQMLVIQAKAIPVLRNGGCPGVHTGSTKWPPVPVTVLRRCSVNALIQWTFPEYLLLTKYSARFLDTNWFILRWTALIQTKTKQVVFVLGSFIFILYWSTDD